MAGGGAGAVAEQQVATEEFDRSAARSVVSDLFARRRWIYCLDFALSYSVLVAAVIIGGWTLSWWTPVMLVVAALAVYRCGGFIHEIQHFRKGEFRSFVFVWNTIFGCALSTPSVLYDMHGRHHSVAKYGTAEDGEYPNIPRPLPARRVSLALFGAARVQVVYMARFTAGTLTKWLRPALRVRIERKWSELHMDAVHERPVFTPEEERRWLPYELLSMAYLIAAFVLVVTGVIPVLFVLFVFLAIVGANTTNFLRVLVVHGNVPRQSARSFEDQVEDSFDHPSIFRSLWGPVGLGFHGTHHMFPTMPYHALGRAHRRLAADPATSATMSIMTRPGLVRSLQVVVRPPQEVALGS